jgi:hypothetical protein
MELSSHWTCSCGALNASDVFNGVCWKCGQDWSDGPVKVQTAEELQMCPDCKATDGFHTMKCPTHPLPTEWLKKP